MNKKIIGILLLAALSIGMFAGCGATRRQTPGVQSLAGQTMKEQGKGEQTPEAQTPEKQQEGSQSEEDLSGGAAGVQQAEPEQGRVILGDEQFDAYIGLLSNKRVALFSNHTGIVGDESSGIGEASADMDASRIPFGMDANGEKITYGQHILDALLAHGVNVTMVFSPEHGFRGTEDAGAAVDDSVDPKTGVPIHSLYGKSSQTPSAEDMAGFDTLVIDMQDVGLRYYTYYISMYYLMDACAAYGKEVVLLDRPNPNGFYVDGPILKKEFQSGVGQLPLPIVYGMTWGELAQMINGEGWLKAGEDACVLTVIPCQNYTHSTKASIIRNPSPNIKDMRAVYLYASTCFFENTVVSVGRGTAFPFEAYGSPYLKDVYGYSFSFTPKSMSGAQNPPFEGKTCYGKDLSGIPLLQIWDEQIHLDYLVDAYHAVHDKYPEVGFFGTPDKQGRYWLDKLCGTDEVRLMIEDGRSADEIKASWKHDIEDFKARRRPYLLYEE